MTTGGWGEGTIVSWREWDEGLATVRLEASVGPFEAGQFFQLGLDLQGERQRRSYSVASAPGEPLEFYLTNVAGGALTPHLFRLRPGDRLWVEGTPRGFFTLRYVPPTPCLWFVATGTGLGPFISMLRTADTWRHAERIVLVHGVRSPAQLAYRQEIEDLCQRRPLRYVPVISGGATPGTLELSGRITTNLENGCLESAAGLRLEPAGHHVLLCGNPEMIREMLTLLEARGLRRHRVRQPGQVTFEKYW
jgi:ferredoxin/flavodoxin---NADP+ reductase